MTDQLVDPDGYLPAPDRYDYIDDETGHAMSVRVDLWGNEYTVDATKLYRVGPNAGSAAPEVGR